MHSSHSGDWVWGVDVAVSHLSFGFAALHHDDLEVESLITRTDLREGARLGWIDRQVRSYAKQTARRYPPACVWVEAPTGRFPNLQLSYAAGVVQAALAETIAAPVWSMPVGKWKLISMGYGNASKAQVAAHVRDKLWVDFDSQDEADALLIATAGRSMFETRSWEVAA